jgi:hypothetical protein
MIRLFTVMALSAVASAAAAQGRPSTLAMSCTQARALVAASGAIVLGTGPHTYDRFVRDQSFCSIGETTQPVWERTADVAQCPIGFRCRLVGENRKVEGR